MSRKTDDLMFGDRLVPGPTPPPHPVAPAGPGGGSPVPPPPAAPIPPGPVPPPPGIPTYPTSHFIDERFNILRAEHLGIKNAEEKLQKTADLNGTKLDSVLQKEEEIKDQLTQGFNRTNTNIDTSRQNILDKVDTRANKIDADNDKIWEKIGHTEGQPTIEQGIKELHDKVGRGDDDDRTIEKQIKEETTEIDTNLKTLFDKVGHEQERTIESEVQQETDQLDQSIADLHAKVGTSTTPNAIGKVTIEDTILEAHGLETTTILNSHEATKLHVTNKVTEARDHIEEDIRTALGMQLGTPGFQAEGGPNYTPRVDVWSKIDGVETKVNGVRTVVDDVQDTLGERGDKPTVYDILEDSKDTLGDRGTGTSLYDLAKDTNDKATATNTTLGDKGNGDTIYQRLTDTQADAASVKATVGVKESNEDTLYKVATDTQQDVSDVHGVVDDVADTLGARGEDGQTVYVKLSDVQEKATEIYDTLGDRGEDETIYAKLANVQATVNAISNTDVLTAVNDIAEDLGDRGEGETLFARVDGISEKVDNMEDKVSALSVSLNRLSDVVSSLLVAIAAEAPDIDPEGTLEFDETTNTLKFTVGKLGLAQPEQICFWKEAGAAGLSEDVALVSTATPQPENPMAYVEGQTEYVFDLGAAPTQDETFYATMEYKRADKDIRSTYYSNKVEFTVQQP